MTTLDDWLGALAEALALSGAAVWLAVLVEALL